MFTLDDDILQQLRAAFKAEAAEHLQAMNRVLLALEENPKEDARVELLEEIFREAHSLKGAAGAVDFSEVQQTAHKLESVFGASRVGKLALTRDLCDVLYNALDAVGTLIKAALEGTDHNLDLAALHARLDAAELGQVLPGAITPPPAVPASPVQSAAAPVAEKPSAPESAAPETEEVPKTRGVTETSAAPFTGPERRKRANPGNPNDETIRVATSKLDSLMARSGELLVAGLKIDQRLNEIKTIGSALDELNREWTRAKTANANLADRADSEASAVKPLLRLMELYQDKIRDLLTQVKGVERGMSGDALHLARVTNDLGEGVMKVRMLPVSSVLDAFPRLIRDAARELGKEVELKIEGADTELDRKVLEEIKDPLIHILRNSVDHGIEMPDVRVKSGKPRLGTIFVNAFQKGNNIVIQVKDDGAGIQRDRVKKQAVKNGLITAEEAGTMSDDAALRLIFAAGLSTSAIISDLSGRGVGMDVVRRNIEAMQGQVDVESTLGVGTGITLTLPLTLATTQQLLVQVDEQIFGIPLAAVERILRIEQKQIGSMQGRPAIVVDNQPIALVYLSDVLEQPRSEGKVSEDGKLPVVVLQSAKTPTAFLVDGVVGQKETVVKSLGKQLGRVRNISGATVLGNGRVILTLNPTDLMKSTRPAESKPSAAVQTASEKTAKKSKHTANIMVVDDSLTTRTREKNILESAGCKVTLAADGQEALNLLHANSGYDVIVSDVIMPRMTGFELTKAIKGDAGLKKIPVVLVTSLGSREDKERGIQAGADAYVVKSNFDQASFLQTIQQLI